MTWDGRSPFVNGHLCGYVDAHFMRRGVVVEWRTLDESRFTGTLRYAGFERGRSAAHLLFVAPETPSLAEAYMRQEAVFPVFLGDAGAVMNAMVRGEVTGTWVPCKRGQSFGWHLESAT